MLESLQNYVDGFIKGMPDINGKPVPECTKTELARASEIERQKAMICLLRSLVLELAAEQKKG